MEGLEISEINTKNLDKIKRRLDAEYYKKEFLQLDSRIKKIGKVDLKKINAKLDCSAFYPSIVDDYNHFGEGIPFLRVNEIKDGLLNISSTTVFLPQEILDQNKSTICIGYPDDLIIAKGGNTLAKVGLLNNSYKYYALSRDIILVRTNELKNYDKTVLWLFFHSKYGQNLLWRTASQTGQPHLTLPSINEIYLPQIGERIVSIVQKLYDNSVNSKIISKQKYSQAENLLLQTFGLQDFQPSVEAVNVKTYKESFVSTGRLDAEYYQPKYDDIEQKFSNKTTRKLKDVFDIFSSPSPSKYLEEGIKVIKTKNVRTPNVDIENIIDHTDETKLLVEKDDLLFASMGVGSLGRVSYIDTKLANCTIDGTIKLFRTKKEFKNQNIEIPTMLFLTSKIGQELIYKYVIGSTGIISISKENVENLLIPEISRTRANELTNMVLESQALKAKSEKLLEVAKRAVEIAIEENEGIAIDYINQNSF